MNALTTILTLCLFCALPISAETPESAPPNRNHETRMLKHLLNMQPEELAALRQTIERIERMSPEEKERMSQRIGQLEQMPPANVEAMRERFESIDPATREAMRQRWFELTPEARREWRQKLREMSREARAEVFEAEGFLPSPGNDRKGPKPPKSEGE